MTIDVFLCHNSNDKPLVIKIAKALEQRGLNPWIDKNNINPGAEFQRAIEQAIPQTKSAAIFFGLNGVGKWQREEINALYREKVNRQQIRLIPVLLPGVSKIPTEFVFLQGHNWLRLVSEEIDEQFLNDFVRGIIENSPVPKEKLILQPDDFNIGRGDNYIRPESWQVDDLSSDRAIDYTRLRDLLAAGNLKDADYETYLVMLQVVGREKGDWIRDQELLHFPCTDLRTIDRLWVKYSNGRFGFSVQKKIYLEVGGKPDGKYYEEAWQKFINRVGWTEKKSGQPFYSVLYFDTTAPVGYLPICLIINFPIWVGVLDIMIFKFTGHLHPHLVLMLSSLLSHRDL